MECTQPEAPSTCLALALPPIAGAAPTGRISRSLVRPGESAGRSASIRSLAVMEGREKGVAIIRKPEDLVPVSAAGAWLQIYRAP